VYIKGRYIVSACALLFLQQALASGMDERKEAGAKENGPPVVRLGLSD